MMKLVLHAVLFSVSAQQSKDDVLVESNVMVAMRDGVKLAVDVYRPGREGRFPVAMLRTPYGTDRESIPGTYRSLVAAGYVVLCWDCRGKFHSEGEWYPLRHEAKDGFDCIEWAATQPWSNSNVGMFGGSYLGWVQMLTAGEGNPHLKALVPQVTPPDPFHNIPYQAGAFLAMSMNWARLVAGREVDAMEQHSGRWLDFYAHRPLLEMDDQTGSTIPFFDDWVRHSKFDDYWKSMSYEHRYGEMDVPALHMTGWFDDDQTGCIRNFVGLRKGARTERARRGQRLLIGPWGHALNSGTAIGELSFGPDSRIDMNATLRRWYDHWLKDEDNGVENDKPVQIFVIGPNQWRDEDDWPLPRTRFTPFYLHAGGVLSTEVPGESAPSDYTYDPEQPTPYLTAEGSAQVGGPDDYADLHAEREDLLLFDSRPLTDAVEVTGPLVVHLHAATSCTDTDWMAMLCDVRPDGKVIRLNDGVQRAMFRESLTDPKPVEAGVVYAYRIDCWATSYVFMPGHRLRVAIASAAFPKFYPNGNTGSLDPSVKEVQVADQEVHHSSQYPSHILLPVIPAR